MFGCGEEQPTQMELQRELASLGEQANRADYDASYEFAEDYTDGDSDGGTFRVVKSREDVLLILNDEAMASRAFLRTTATFDESQSTACEVRTLGDNKERVCLDLADDAWSISFATVYPLALLLDSAEIIEGLGESHLRRLDSREIANQSGTCIKITNPVDDLSGELEKNVELCFSKSGVPLFQSTDDGTYKVVSTATKVGISDATGVEIPYRVVREESLPGGECVAPYCVIPD